MPGPVPIANLTARLPCEAVRAAEGDAFPPQRVRVRRTTGPAACWDSFAGQTIRKYLGHGGDNCPPARAGAIVDVRV